MHHIRDRYPFRGNTRLWHHYRYRLGKRGGANYTIYRTKLPLYQMSIDGIFGAYKPGFKSLGDTNTDVTQFFRVDGERKPIVYVSLDVWHMQKLKNIAVGFI